MRDSTKMCERAEGAGRGDGMKMPARQAGLAPRLPSLPHGAFGFPAPPAFVSPERRGSGRPCTQPARRCRETPRHAASAHLRKLRWAAPPSTGRAPGAWRQMATPPFSSGLISARTMSALAVSTGLVTAVGRRSAHAALAAQQMNKPCVVAAPTQLRCGAPHRQARRNHEQ